MMRIAEFTLLAAAELTQLLKQLSNVMKKLSVFFKGMLPEVSFKTGGKGEMWFRAE